MLRTCPDCPLPLAPLPQGEGSNVWFAATPIRSVVEEGWRTVHILFLAGVAGLENPPLPPPPFVGEGWGEGR